MTELTVFLRCRASVCKSMQDAGSAGDHTMKPLPLAIIVILTWTVLVFVDNWPREAPQAHKNAEAPIVTASTQPPSPQLQMTEQPRYRSGR